MFILIACVNGLAGFLEAIATIFPKTEVQSRIIHQIRNSLRDVALKDSKAFMTDLKKVYQASTLIPLQNPTLIKPPKYAWVISKNP